MHLSYQCYAEGLRREVPGVGHFFLLLYIPTFGEGNFGQTKGPCKRTQQVTTLLRPTMLGIVGTLSTINNA